MLLLVCSLLLLSDTFAYPSGAPDSACATQTPGHRVPAQKVSCPYEIQASGWVPGVNSFTLKGKSKELFRGYIVTVLDKKSVPVGTFSSELSDQAKLICNKTSITQSEASDKHSITLTWIAPQNLPEDTVLTVRYAVVQVKRTFWVDCNPVKLTANNSGGTGGTGGTGGSRDSGVRYSLAGTKEHTVQQAEEPEAKKSVAGSDEPAPDQASGEPPEENPQTGEPAGEKTDAGEPAGENPDGREPAEENTDAGEPAGENPDVREPAGENTDAGEPAGENPFVREPAVENTNAGEPAGGNMDAGEAAGENPDEGEPAGANADDGKTTAQKPGANEPKAETFEPFRDEEPTNHYRRPIQRSRGKVRLFIPNYTGRHIMLRPQKYLLGSALASRRTNNNYRSYIPAHRQRFSGRSNADIGSFYRAWISG